MSLNLIDMAKGLFAGEVASKAAAAFGESESNVTKAFGGMVPAIFSQLADKTATGEGAESIARLAQEQAGSGLFGNLGSLLGGGDNSSWLSKGSGLVSSLFGNKVDGIVSLLSNFAGIKSSSSSSLLSLAVPAILGFLGKHMGANNLGASGLASLLGGQKSFISSALPAGLSLGNLFGSSADAHVKAAAPHVAAATRYEEEDNGGGGMKWLWPLLLLALLGAAALYFFKGGCNKKDDTHTTATTTGGDSTNGGTTVGNAMDTLSAKVGGSLDSLGNWVYNLGADVNLDLPGGGKLVVGENSTEAKLVKFLNSSDPVDTTKGNWFDFTNVRFETSKSTITKESMAQLTNMVTIAKAYPNAKFKIGGYTDNTGNEANNVKLSKERAAAVAAEITKMGATNIVSSDGYGSQFPIADNATLEGRAQNRRVSVNVKAK